MSEFLLEVWTVEQTCLFKLSSLEGHYWEAHLHYPERLCHAYQDWSSAYQRYYRQKRARPGFTATISVTENLETDLNSAEQILISEFHHWVWDATLTEIRRVLTDAAKEETAPSSSVNLLVHCKEVISQESRLAHSFSLAKLPWERLGVELRDVSDKRPIHILRTVNKYPVPATPIKKRRARILAILGDEEGLDFQKERDAIEKKLKPIAYVQFEGWNITPPVHGSNLKEQLREAIADPRGWDILFFAGHSHEKFGGELMLAPNYSALIDEFEDALRVAQQNGLRFALFNSCLGCAIAEKLVRYGLDYVAVMREPISNAVAQEFFKEFSQHVANFVDVKTATLRACEFLRHLAKDRSQYPSAFLVPSIYTYCGIKPFAIPQSNWRMMLSQLKPTRQQAIVLVALIIMSSQSSIQYPLIDQRQFIQAVYRDIGNLIKIKAPDQKVPTPEILLVKIDNDSLNAAKVQSRDPIDRSYMEKLVSRAIKLNTPTIAIDYALAYYRPEQKVLKETLARPTVSRFVFGASEETGIPDQGLMNPSDRIDGDIDLNTGPRTKGKIRDLVFFARTIGDLSELSIYPFSHQVLCVSQYRLKNCKITDRKAYYNPVTFLSHSVASQQWLNPWIDYSIPTQQVYDSVSAQDFLSKNQKSYKITMIVASSEEDQDPFLIPTAMINHISTTNPPKLIAGGEIHAYQLYNLLHQGLIIPIPDVWAIGIVGIFSKLALTWIQILPNDKRISHRGWGAILVIGPLVSYVVILQIYITLGIMIPIVFPTLVYLSYWLPIWWQQKFKRLSSRALAKYA